MRYSFDPSRPAGHRIISAEVKNPNGSFSPIQPNTVYQLTTNDFLRRGGDGYSLFFTNAINPYDTWAVMAQLGGRVHPGACRLTAVWAER